MRTFLIVAALLALGASAAHIDARLSCPSGHKVNQWNYANEATWGELCAAYETCATGAHQSPVDIAMPFLGSRAAPSFDYSTTKLNLVRVGGLVTLPVTDESTMTVDGDTYSLSHIQFHQPSEHTLNGRHYRFEAQLFHTMQDSAGREHTAAVAVLFDECDCPNRFMEKLVPLLPQQEQCLCGNGRRENFAIFDEECDQALRADLPNFCRADCAKPFCGDAIVDDRFNEECDDGRDNKNRSDACRLNCRLPFCGDEIIDVGAGEACDDGENPFTGNRNESNACRTTCVLPRCGDGIVDDLFGEDCDDGDANNAEGNPCGPQCLLCGNGLPDPGEECDDGFLLNSLEPNANCRPNCRLRHCGDGVWDPQFEECDDEEGNDVVDSRCRPGCTRPVCGDNVTDTSRPFFETCDNGGFADPSVDRLCNGTICQLYCGNGVVELDEECDDGDANSDVVPSACRLNCFNATCGDGITDPGEQCDDGEATFRCKGNCTWGCGDGIVDLTAGEECDNGHRSIRGFDGNSNLREDACRENCKLPSCGDGVVDYNEQCDDGADNNDSEPGACRTDCHRACCGDGTTDPAEGEQCDEGSDRNGAADGMCTSDCRLQCGDGVRNLIEECDDGINNSDSLANSCREALSCREHYCGDGVTDGDEQCDPMSPRPKWEKCLSSCVFAFCGDGVTDAELGEECDNGDENGYDVIDLAFDDTNRNRACSPICTLNRCGQTLSHGIAKVADLLPANVSSAMCYEGSLTHPPCTEGVRWIVLEDKQCISRAQADTFEKIIGRRNSRQNTHGTIGSLPGPTCDVPTTTTLPAECGNGIVEVGEVCDNGVENDDRLPNRCRTNCKPSFCGDGVRDQNEECDGEVYCSSSCSIIEEMQTRTCDNWNYDYQAWHSLGEQCSACAGARQSPVDLGAAFCPNTTHPLQLNHPSNVKYNDSPVLLINTGNTVRWSILNGGSFSYAGYTYTLTHVEFREPSEHYIDGKRFAFEVQLFHTLQNPSLAGQQHAVLAVLYDEKPGATNEFLEQFVRGAPWDSDCTCGNGKIDPVYIELDGTIRAEECDAGELNSDSLPGRCRTNCKMPHCGDGVRDLGEECDQGEYNSYEPNHCRPDCTVPKCGDGIIDDCTTHSCVLPPGSPAPEHFEECDDGADNGDLTISGCSLECKQLCGNGEIDGLEECDAGEYNSDTRATSCRSGCTIWRCGDGIVDADEECDDGPLNGDSASKCRLDCTRPFCGDGILDYGEECDFGLAPEPALGCVGPESADALPGSACCKLCGNGRIDPGEQCDNATLNSDVQPDACRTNCMLPVCGDGVIDFGEACDEGEDNIRCTGCEVKCGNGIIDEFPTEQCDLGVLNSDTEPNTCRRNCQLPWCGDGITDIYCLEECDDGHLNADAPGACRANCRRPYCGDGIVDPDEWCDDGNNDDRDGCPGDCQRAETLCGNGHVDAGEQCDDGDLNSDVDAGCCRTNCMLARCGDGVVDGDEECDDGAALNADAPNKCRTDCTLPKCGDNIRDNLYGESCDHGAENNLENPYGCSPSCVATECRQTVDFNTQINPSGFLPSEPGAFAYDGSLNSPPCTENAEWFVFANAQPIGHQQLSAFRRVMRNNARSLHPLKDRVVAWLQDVARCGDGIVEGNEECDNGAANSDVAPNACRTTCKKAKCGDGVVDWGESCDGGNDCNRLTCKLACDGNNCPTKTPCTQGDASAMPPVLAVINVNFAHIYGIPPLK